MYTIIVYLYFIMEESLMKKETVNGILKSRFKDGGMPSPWYGTGGHISNKSQISRCIINTWLTLIGKSSMMICDDDTELSDTDSLVYMSRLFDITLEYPIESTYNEEFETKYDISYNEFMQAINAFVNEYIILMKDTSSQFFLKALRIRYNKYNNIKEEVNNEPVTVFKRRKSSFDKK